MNDLPPIEYDDLVIRIEPEGDGGFEVSAYGPGAGSARAPFVPPFDADHLDAKLDGIARAVQAGTTVRHLEGAAAFAAERVDPKTAGRELFAALFRDEVRLVLFQALALHGGEDDPGLRLRLIVDPRQPGCAAIAALPWELLYDDVGGRGFLCARVRTSVVRYLEVNAAHRVRKIRGPLRVLVALASPTELPTLDLDAERRAAEGWGDRSDVVVEVLEHATIDQVKSRLRQRRFHALHFTGHGDFLRGDERGVLLFERPDGRAEAADGELLAALLDDCRSLRLVVLNACFGGRIPRREGLDPYAGVAAALVRGGVPVVVAMQFAISDGAGVQFCGDFYEALAQGDPVDAAVAEGRRGILRRNSSSLEWSAPVLHLRVTDGRLFQRRPAHRRWLAAALLVLIAAAGAVGGWLWLGRSGDGSGDGPRRYERPVVAAAEGCPAPPGLPDLAFVRIEPGRLELPAQGAAEEGVRTLAVERPFCLGVFEITTEQFQAVMGIGDRRAADPDRTTDPHLPAGAITWDEADVFISRINGEVRGSPFRLPTGVEWEYAARAGTTTAYSFGDDQAELHRYGNCLGGGSEEDGFDHRPAPVGWFEPNPRGLYDVHGNLWEWVDEELRPEDLSATEPRNETGARTAVYRVRRGGSYDSAPEKCTSDGRSAVQGNRKVLINGLRLAREVEPGG